MSKFYSTQLISVIRDECVSVQELLKYNSYPNSESLLNKLNNRNIDVSVLYSVSIHLNCKNLDNELKNEILNAVRAYFSLYGEDAIKDTKKLNEYCHYLLNKDNFYIKIIQVTKSLPQKLQNSENEITIYNSEASDYIENKID